MPKFSRTSKKKKLRQVRVLYDLHKILELTEEIESLNRKLVDQRTILELEIDRHKRTIEGLNQEITKVLGDKADALSAFQSYRYGLSHTFQAKYFLNRAGSVLLEEVLTFLRDWESL